jgi:hypothetical protein
MPTTIATLALAELSGYVAMVRKGSKRGRPVALLKLVTKGSTETQSMKAPLKTAFHLRKSGPVRCKIIRPVISYCDDRSVDCL